MIEIFLSEQRGQSLALSYHYKYIAAINLLKEIVSNCGKILENIFLDLFVKHLPRYERGARLSLPEHKDHIIHTAYVYILGLYLTDHLTGFREENLAYILNDHNDWETGRRSSLLQLGHRRNLEDTIPEFLCRWRIAALFHDCSYPLEINVKQIKDYAGKAMSALKDSETIFQYEFPKFEELNCLNRPFYEENTILPWFPEKTATELWASNIRTKLMPEYENYQINNAINSYITDGLKKGYADHGVFGSLFLLKTLHDNILKDYDLSDGRNITNHSWEHFTKKLEYEQLYTRMIDASGAIFLHNFHILKKSINIFKDKRIDSLKHPLAFMLKLCDELQQWDRLKGEDIYESTFSDYPFSLTTNFNYGRAIARRWDGLDSTSQTGTIDDTHFKEHCSNVLRQCSITCVDRCEFKVPEFFTHYLWNETEFRNIQILAMDYLNTEITLDARFGAIPVNTDIAEFDKKIKKKLIKLVTGGKLDHLWPARFIRFIILIDELLLLTEEANPYLSIANHPQHATEYFQSISDSIICQMNFNFWFEYALRFIYNYNRLKLFAKLLDSFNLVHFQINSDNLLELLEFFKNNEIKSYNTFKSTPFGNKDFSERFKSFINYSNYHDVEWSNDYNDKQRSMKITVHSFPLEPSLCNEEFPTIQISYLDENAIAKPIEVINDCLSFTNDTGETTNKLAYTNSHNDRDKLEEICIKSISRLSEQIFRNLYPD